MRYFYLFLFGSLISCSDVKKDNVVFSAEESVKGEAVFFPEFYSKDTLCLNVSIDDCGEWGGPEDKFRIYMDSLRRYVLEFERYNMDCDSMIFYHGEQKPLKLKKRIVLNDTTKKAISNLLINIMQSKIEEYNDSNGGSVYELFTNDSTLFVQVHSTEKQIEEDYYNFKKNMGLPENRKEETKLTVIIDGVQQ